MPWRQGRDGLVLMVERAGLGFGAQCPVFHGGSLAVCMHPVKLSITHKSLTQIEILNTEKLNRMNPL